MQICNILGYSCRGEECNYDSYVAHRLLKGRGCVLIGITNMDEFGMGSLGTNAPNGATKNPISIVQPFWNNIYNNINHSIEKAQIYLIKNPSEVCELRKTSYDMINPSEWLCVGGSSSGSASSISFGSTLLSIGTDAGGSVRLPSSWTNIVGLKPTYGLISSNFCGILKEECDKS